MDANITGCETPVVSAANGAANPTISSLVTFGVEVVKVDVVWDVRWYYPNL